MALEAQLAEKEAAAAQAPQPAQPGIREMDDDEEKDLEIAVLLAKHMIDDGGIEVIQKAAGESSDAGQVIGQFMMQMVSQLAEMLPPEMQLSNTIYFAQDGWVEQISDYLQEEYDIPRKVMDRAEVYIGTTAQQIAKRNQGQVAPEEQAADPAAQAAPPLPAGGA